MGVMKKLNLLFRELDSKSKEIHQSVVYIRKIFIVIEEETDKIYCLNYIKTL